jgi:Flp pilus assembly protein TadG
MSARDNISNGLRHLRNVCCRTDTSLEDQSESGAALVEFTILMPVLFLILFGIIEFGMIIFTQNNMTNADREGARTAAVQSSTLTPAQQVATANTWACKWLVGTGQTFTITSTDKCTGVGSATQDIQVQLTVSAASASLMNTFFTLTNGALTASTWNGTFSSAATMRKETTCTAAGTSATCSCNTAANPPTGC